MFCDTQTLKMGKLVSAGSRSGVTHKDNLLVNIGAWMLNHHRQLLSWPCNVIRRSNMPLKSKHPKHYYHVFQML